MITWSKKYADRERLRREGALDYAKHLTNAELFRQTGKKGGKSILTLATLTKKLEKLNLSLHSSISTKNKLTLILNLMELMF